ncbi:MAG: hypothetical protein O2950_08190 [Proteobacteria bacterium]|nr:hypothetical protein [Pseudomonadota bacterium]MDA1352252.1 hypothetical protein [Pseudomonadota bacterium]
MSNFAAMDPMELFIGLLAGVFGMVYFMYGKKSAKYGFLLSGLALMVAPYFVYSIWPLGLTCTAICVAPFFVKI